MSHKAREELYTSSEYPFGKSHLLDRRLMALKYSETFKVSSRAEASVVLKLTQQLSDSLEQYFLNSKGLEILSSNNYGNEKLESTVEKPQLDIEPTLYAGTSTITDVSSWKECKTEVISSRRDAFPKGSSCSASQSRRLQKFEAHDEIPFASSQPVEQNSEDVFLVSQINLNTKSVKVHAEAKTHIVSSDLETKTQSDIGMKNDESDFDASSLHSSSSQETKSSSQAQRKTTKSLSPDILQLLKGKDANTVTNILKTLSPFYPALQDVNLEILAQVLVNTGALD